MYVPLYEALKISLKAQPTPERPTGKPKSAELSGNSAALEKSCEFGGSDGKNPGRVWEFWSCGIMLQELQHSFSFKEKFLL